MAGQRTEGASGLWDGHAAAEHGFWPGGFQGDHPIPTRAAPLAASAAGPAGGEKQVHGDIVADDIAGHADDVPKFPQFYRRIEVQGYPLKVRYTPEWAAGAKALYESDEVDQDALDTFIDSIQGKVPAARSFIVSTLRPIFRARQDTATLKAIASLAPLPTSQRFA